MKINQIVFLLFLLTAASFPQAADSAGADTVRFDDSTTVILPDSAAADTSALFTADSLMADTLNPLYSGPLSGQSSFISPYKIRMNDYENTNDILKSAPFAFVSETGLYGNEDNLYLYGQKSVYMSDGVVINDQRMAAFDLNLMQSELIDSVELISLPRNFLYSPGMERAAVNFIEKDFLAPVPYTRIKYYEGPNGDAFFDGIVNTNIGRRLNLMLDITNRKSDGSFTNSDFSQWLGTVKLKYFFSDELNITGSYNYIKNEFGMNGGINTDSVKQLTDPSEFKDYVYDEIRAIVWSPQERYKTTGHNFKVKGIWSPDSVWRTEVSAYSWFRQYDDTGFLDSLSYKTKTYTYGITGSQSFSQPYYKLKLSSSYLWSDFNFDSFINDIEDPGSRKSSIMRFSLVPEAAFYFADSTLVTTVFFKYLNTGINNPDYSGYGFDLAYYANGIKLFGGLSYYDQYGEKVTAAEAGAAYSNNYFNGSIRLFSLSNIYYSYVQQQGNLSGVSIAADFMFWKFLIETNTSFYFDNKNEWLPDYHTITGLYFKDILFKEHLDLKTGFVLHLNEGFDNFLPVSEEVSALFNDINYRVDFTLAGIISKVATIYFTWENLSNNQYFIVPYYPMPERNIRFGLSWELFN